MRPSGLAILIGVRLANVRGWNCLDACKPNLAVALLAPKKENVEKLCISLRRTSNGGVLHSFPSNSKASDLQRTFARISTHPAFKYLKLKLAVFHAKHTVKEPSLETVEEESKTILAMQAKQTTLESSSLDQDEIKRSLAKYTAGAPAFGQEAFKLFYEQNGGKTTLGRKNGKMDDIIFKGTLPTLLTSDESITYGADVDAVRMISEGLATEHSKGGIHAFRTIV
ncbi:oxidoreductase [Seiridium cupressi]